MAGLPFLKSNRVEDIRRVLEELYNSVTRNVSGSGATTTPATTAPTTVIQAGRPGSDGKSGKDGKNFVPTRKTLLATTASVEPQVRIELDLAFPRSADLLAVGADYPAWICGYGSPEARTADVIRDIDVRPNTGQGLSFELFTAEDLLLVQFDPIAHPWNQESPSQGRLYLSLVNLDSVARAFNLSLVYLPKES